MNRIIYLVLLFATLTNISARGQEYNTARLTILFGGNIPFHFNTLEKYIDGITVTDGTVFGITMADSSVLPIELLGFDLNFRSFNGQPVLQGISNTIPLESLQVLAESEIGLGAGSSSGYQDLSTGWVNLFSYTQDPWVTDLTWDNHQISVSYAAGLPVASGGNGNFLNNPADYYTVEIEFELIPTGNGF